MIYIIAEMLEESCDELCHSKHYYKKARMLKADHLEVARKYIAISKEKLEHAHTLFTLAESLYGDLDIDEKQRIERMFEDKKEEYIECYDKLNYAITKIMY